MTDDKELLWKEYALDLDLYRHYLELVLKFNAFYYAISGAIVSFFLSRSDKEVTKWALALPFILRVALAWFFLRGAKLNENARQNVRQKAEALGFAMAPEVGVLKELLYGSAVLFIVVAVGLIVMFCNASTLR